MRAADDHAVGARAERQGERLKPEIAQRCGHSEAGDLCIGQRAAAIRRVAARVDVDRIGTDSTDDLDRGSDAFQVAARRRGRRHIRGVVAGAEQDKGCRCHGLNVGSIGVVAGVHRQHAVDLHQVDRIAAGAGVDEGRPGMGTGDSDAVVAAQRIKSHGFEADVAGACRAGHGYVGGAERNLVILVAEGDAEGIGYARAAIDRQRPR